MRRLCEYCNSEDTIQKFNIPIPEEPSIVEEFDIDAWEPYKSILCKIEHPHICLKCLTEALKKAVK